MSATKVITGVVRGSYLNLFEPRSSNDGGDPKYGLTILIPKTDTATLKKIRDAQETAIISKWPNKRPPKIDTTLHDGDGVRPASGEPFGEECKGHYVMTVSSKDRPGLVDSNVEPILDRGSVVSGDYFRVSMNAYAYDTAGKRGVSFGLNNVQFIRKGEPLTSKSRAEDDFDAIDDEEDFI